MEEYSNDSIERDLGYHIEDSLIPIQPRENNDRHEFKKVLKETEKSWLLQMMGDNEIWFPKSQCEINRNIIIAPKWLLKRIAGFD